MHIGTYTALEGHTGNQTYLRGPGHIQTGMHTDTHKHVRAHRHREHKCMYTGTDTRMRVMCTPSGAQPLMGTGKLASQNQHHVAYHTTSH